MSNFPGIIEYAEGLRLVDDVLSQPGVDTLEGRVGPLIFGSSCRAHYIDMPAHSYVDEHGHDDEALTYTVRGKWVLCANGKRRLMKPGSLYWFAPDIPTGYEVPFDEPAYLLVFRGVVSGTEKDWMSYLETELPSILAQMQASGDVFMLRDLPKDHPALKFAHEVNPAQY